MQSINDAKLFGLRSDQRTTTVDGLLPNLDYCFRVRAINDLGEGQEASKKSGVVVFFLCVQLSLCLHFLSEMYNGEHGRLGAACKKL